MRGIEHIDATIKDIMHFHLGTPVENVTPNATFEDLGADSLDCIEICMDIEDKFSIIITEEELDKCLKISDLDQLLRAKLPLITPPG